MRPQAARLLTHRAPPQFGYIVYRTVLGYYSGDEAEDAYDMRKALPRDVHRKSVVPLRKPITPAQLEHD